MFVVSPPGTCVHIRKKLVGRATIKVKALTMSWDLVTKNLALEESGRSRFKSSPAARQIQISFSFQALVSKPAK